MGHLDGDVRPVSQPPVWCTPPGPPLGKREAPSSHVVTSYMITELSICL